MGFILFCPRFYVTLDNLLHLGIKNKQVYFVLSSILRNFAGSKRDCHEKSMDNNNFKHYM